MDINIDKILNIDYNFKAIRNGGNNYDRKLCSNSKSRNTNAKKY